MRIRRRKMLLHSHEYTPSTALHRLLYIPPGPYRVMLLVSIRRIGPGGCGEVCPPRTNHRASLSDIRSSCGGSDRPRALSDGRSYGSLGHSDASIRRYPSAVELRLLVPPDRFAGSRQQRPSGRRAFQIMSVNRPLI